ncbi:uncharacterized protein MONOS_10940 [Monocercomonoides exilis]|uniref:uncharacterized protein n=1 Tax=Monocercomonoides exilis TaxID=2049356 RepID=UPI00355A30AD|nr:hypothetical protein MONOS_10940 [Monocercomonoides exilis]|eukprot:MONOS_10940.1-p1 / transcript=MONOS_10940.1 / gene=MONOS_10940 / organism=Monocercomonoides_exilis_PA203 / gene_product=unspecified product / transcript_product=unspecified product / location=Mono_scaffold00520:21992-22321(+) / protein_length=110 / sequence_SO=supercontig / SO=protein_coding / is_pseudo=false
MATPQLMAKAMMYFSVTMQSPNSPSAEASSTSPPSPLHSPSTPPASPTSPPQPPRQLCPLLCHLPCPLPLPRRLHHHQLQLSSTTPTECHQWRVHLIRPICPCQHIFGE